MPGVGVRTAARLLTEVAHRAFASAAHLAAYAGLAPVTRRSGSSIRGEHPSRRGNKVLKRALFLSALAALRDPVSRAYYARKIQQGKRHNQALIALARRRCDVLFAMLRVLAAGRVDAAVNDRLMLGTLMRNSHLPLRPGSVVSGGDDQMSIPFSKGNPKFAKAIDDAIEAMKQDGTLK